MGRHDVEQDEEYEVDEVMHRVFKRNKYYYAVSNKGWDQVSPERTQDHRDFGGCQAMLEEFNAANPFGSSKRDSPADIRQYERKRNLNPRRRSNRLRRVAGVEGGHQPVRRHRRIGEDSADRVQQLRMMYAKEYFSAVRW